MAAGARLITVYGLKSCDTCRKALGWLKGENLAHRFHDLRADGISRADIARFAGAVGWEKLLNKASATWRALDDEAKEGVTEARALALMAEQPALIKRPVFEAGAKIVVGFREAEKAALKALSK
jgi:arsenate reductase